MGSRMSAASISSLRDSNMILSDFVTSKPFNNRGSHIEDVCRNACRSFAEDSNRRPSSHTVSSSGEVIKA